jgi:hypothetical protein
MPVVFRIPQEHPQRAEIIGLLGVARADGRDGLSRGWRDGGLRSAAERPTTIARSPAEEAPGHERKALRSHWRLVFLKRKQAAHG